MVYQLNYWRKMWYQNQLPSIIVLKSKIAYKVSINYEPLASIKAARQQYSML